MSIADDEAMLTSPVLRKKKSRSLRGLLLQAVFVMQAPEHGRLFDAMTGWQLVPMVAARNAVLGGSGKPGPSVE